MERGGGMVQAEKPLLSNYEALSLKSQYCQNKSFERKKNLLTYNFVSSKMILQK
jgi:hypothetical protein